MISIHKQIRTVMTLVIAAVSITLASGQSSVRDLTSCDRSSAWHARKAMERACSN